jgi:hypothetical protein
MPHLYNIKPYDYKADAKLLSIKSYKNFGSPRSPKGKYKSIDFSTEKIPITGTGMSGLDLRFTTKMTKNKPKLLSSYDKISFNKTSFE